MNSRLLIITCHRLSDNNGGANASKGFILCLSSLFNDCSLIFPEFDNPSEYIPSNVKLYPCHDSRQKIQKGLDMYRGVVNALYSCVREHLKSHQYDVIVIDHSVTGTGIIKTLKRTGAKVITIHHNVERDYLRDNGNERPATFRYPYNYFAKKSERDCLRLSDVNLTLTEKDAETFRSWYKDRDIHAHCIGICEYKGIPATIVPDASPTIKVDKQGPTFAITGSLCFLQSLLPIIEFVKTYYPILQQECPEAKLFIAGRNPSPQLLDACAGHANIKVIANPQDMASVIRQVDYYICPINAGSGIKLRVMDGLKQGLPVLCHDVSANGYEALEAQGCIFRYNDVQSFRSSLMEVLSYNASHDTTYQTFRAYFSPEAMTERLYRIFKIEKII